jgi:hypothetical protein
MKKLSQESEIVFSVTTIVETEEGNVVVKDIRTNEQNYKILSTDFMWEKSGKYLTDDLEENSALIEEIEEFLSEQDDWKGKA